MLVACHNLCLCETLFPLLKVNLEPLAFRALQTEHPELVIEMSGIGNIYFLKTGTT